MNGRKDGREVSLECSDRCFDGGDDLAACHQILDRGQLGRQPAVRVRARRPRSATRPSAAPVPSAGNERRPQVEAPGRAGQLDGQDAGQVGHGRAQLAGRAPGHRHVVLLHGARRHGVDRGRSSQPPVLGHHRRLRVVADHHAGVDAGVRRQEGREAVRAGAVEHPVGAALGQRAQVGHGDGQEVAHVAERRAVEVAARLHPAVGQDHRVVDGRHELVISDGRCMCNRVPNGAVDLRRAAQRVGVLHPGIVLAMAGHDGGAGQQPAEVLGAHGLPGLGPERLQVGGEGPIGAQQRLDGHGGGDVGRLAAAGGGPPGRGRACRGCRRSR